MNRKRSPQTRRAPRARKTHAPPATEALEASGLVGWEFDVADGRIRLSGLWNEMLGGAREAVVVDAEKLFALVPGADRQGLQEVFYGTLKGEREHYQYEHRVRSPSGKTIWVQATGRVLARDAKGKARRLAGTVRDISREMQDRAALARSEARFRQLTLIDSDWIWELDEKFRFSHIEGKGLEKVGIVPREVIGKRSLDVGNFRIIDMNRVQFEDLRRRHQPYRNVLACFDLVDGSERFVRVTGEPVFDESGAFRGYRGVTRDVTEQINAERALRESDARFRSAFEGSAIGMAINAPNGRLMRVNVALCNMLGYTREELQARTFQEITHPDDLSLNLDLYRDTLSGERSTYQLDKRYLKKNGEPLWVQLNVSLVRDSHDRPLQFVTQVQDISAQRAAQEAAEHLALHDALTGLANKRLLPDRIAGAIASARRARSLVAVMFIDLNGFKPVNDRLGHAAGDHLLKEIAHRLKAAVRGGDTVARTGGDEFVAVITGATRVEALRPAAQRLLDQIARPCEIGDESVQVSASLGIALFPDDAEDPAELLYKADAAMYKAKRAGGGMQLARDIAAS